MLVELLLPLLVGWIGSFSLERLLQPTPLLPWRRPLPTVLLHCGLWLLLFAVLLLLLRRPWFAMAILWAVQVLLLLVHQAKYHSLREAFIFQDFEYFTDAIKHPRLYLPFFGVIRTIAATVGFVAALGMGLWLEMPLPMYSLITTWLAFGLAGVFLLAIGVKDCPSISCTANADLQQLGLLSFFWQYAQAEQRDVIDTATSPFNEPPPALTKQKLPNIVAVQSESFFDPRSLSDTINTQILQHFDETKRQARYAGRMQVPAWGANTVRTECAFLSGLTPEQLGVHQFNPYRVLAKQGIVNLIGSLNALGYRTVCLHPYPASFYLRDRVFPRMGFAQFLDITDFVAQPKQGQFIDDLQVAEKVEELLRANEGNDQPLFIFVITMVNHGPLHLELYDSTQNNQLYSQTPAAAWHDLSVYLTHLRNADAMIAQLKNTLQQTRRAGVLCWYGDHVPIMPTVYASLAEPDGLSDYFIWQTNAVTGEKNKSLAAHELGRLLLDVVVASNATSIA